eukprot:3224305-Pyramimonas_sp.AAC.1
MMLQVLAYVFPFHALPVRVGKGCAGQRLSGFLGMAISRETSSQQIDLRDIAFNENKRFARGVLEKLMTAKFRRLLYSLI